MLIQLDHILKSFKISLMIILILGLSLIFIACDNSELKIIDKQTEISNIKTYSLSNYNNKNLIELNLENSYPNLLFVLKLQDDTTQVEKILLSNPSETLSWSFLPQEIDVHNNKYIGANNINLYSGQFEEGLYNFTLISSDGKAINDSIYINNNLNSNEINLYINNDKLYFSNTKINNNDMLNNFIEIKESQNLSNFELSLYDEKKQLIETKYYAINNIDLDTYFINTNSFIPYSYIQIEYMNKEVKNIIKIDLSSTNSSF